jgi:hypothetical protein
VQNSRAGEDRKGMMAFKVPGQACDVLVCTVAGQDKMLGRKQERDVLKKRRKREKKRQDEAPAVAGKRLSSLAGLSLPSPSPSVTLLLLFLL